MSTSAPSASGRAVFRACVVNAVRRGEALMVRLIAATAAALAAQESSARSPLQREQCLEALRLLRAHEGQLLKAYPMALLEVFTQSGDAGPSANAPVAATATGMGMGADWSLVDDGSIQGQVDFSRTQQAALYASDAALDELNTLLSAAQGLRRVRPDSNPLRPENYVRALQSAIRETRVSNDVRQLWMRCLREPLGTLLTEEYQEAARMLRQHGVQPAPYAPTTSSTMGSGYGVGATGYGTGYGAGELLTANTLRQMLTQPPTPDSDALLPVIELALRRFEPVVQKLAYRDPHFFHNPEHPARQLLVALTEHGRRFTSADSPGLEHFVRTIDKAAAHLAGQSQPDAAVFASIRSALQTAWKMQAEKEQARHKKQQRATLQQQIAVGMANLADTQRIPADILDFAMGPWAEVVAQAHLSGDADARQEDPGGYLALVPDLFWSVQAAQVQHDPQRLRTLGPTLYETVRRGLHSTGHSEERIASFLSRLQRQHGQILAAHPLHPLPPSAVAPTQAEEGSAAAVGMTSPAAIALDIDLQAAAPVLPQVTDPQPGFRVGMWVELNRQNQPSPLRTQLTWVSPNKMLFLFTAPDGSTQSMTRRVCDKLLAEGALRLLAG